MTSLILMWGYKKTAYFFVDGLIQRCGLNSLLRHSRVFDDGVCYALCCGCHKRRRNGLNCFIFGTGILIIGAAAIVESLTLPTSFLNLFLYGSSVNACLSSNMITLLTCVAVSIIGAVIYNIVGSFILSKSDVY